MRIFCHISQYMCLCLSQGRRGKEIGEDIVTFHYVIKSETFSQSFCSKLGLSSLHWILLIKCVILRSFRHSDLFTVNVCSCVVKPRHNLFRGSCSEWVMRLRRNEAIRGTYALSLRQQLQFEDAWSAAVARYPGFCCYEREIWANPRIDVCSTRFQILLLFL